MEDKRQVDINQVSTYVDEEDLLYFETSAKTGENVENMFKKIGEKLPKNKEVYSQNNKIKPVYLKNNTIKNTCC